MSSRKHAAVLNRNNKKKRQESQSLPRLQTLSHATMQKLLETYQGLLLLISQAQIYIYERFREAATQVRIRMTTQRCPGCRAQVERNGGCSTIHCLCTTTFCYHCGFRNDGSICQLCDIVGIILFYGGIFSIVICVVILFFMGLGLFLHWAYYIPLVSNALQLKALCGDSWPSLSSCMKMEMKQDIALENHFQNELILFQHQDAWKDYAKLVHIHEYWKNWTRKRDETQTLVALQETSKEFCDYTCFALSWATQISWYKSFWSYHIYWGARVGVYAFSPTSSYFETSLRKLLAPYLMDYLWSAVSTANYTKCSCLLAT